MNSLWSSVVAIAVIAAGAVACFSPEPAVGLACSESGACPSGQFCVAGICRTTAISGCPNQCGDVDGDGMVSSTDVSTLAALDEGAGVCERAAADVDGNGEVEAPDKTLLELSLEIGQPVTCSACPDVVCGDIDGDDDPNLNDTLALIDFVNSGEAPESLCQYLNYDFNRDGVINVRDVRVQAAIAFNNVQPTCGVACTGTCADLNDDGDINSGDVGALSNAMGEDGTDICTFDIADINSDGRLSIRDNSLVVAIFFGWVPMPAQGQACEECDRICGDVNNNGEVTVADVVALGNIELGTSDLSACDFDIADVNGDANITARDINAVGAVLAGQVAAPGGRCFDCTGICGDADQNGTFDSSADSAAANMVATGGGTFQSMCAFDAADIDGNGTVDSADVSAIASGSGPTCATGTDL